MSNKGNNSLGILTSGGDAQGMNAAVRAVVRTALDRGIEVYGVYAGYQGMVDGGDAIRRLAWDDVGGILQQAGTILGSARCAEFREREGRLQAARNLLAHGIDRLVVIGGDGSLTGANLFREEWSDLLAELVRSGEIDQATADAHPLLTIVGLVGSIDNDMFGTDMTIGTDSALHRITDAIDAIISTAASHHRTFVVEVMGRNCGYLAMMSAIACAASWVLIPENPPREDDWEKVMCDRMVENRNAGRRYSIVVVAEGARDRHGQLISSDYVKRVLEERLQLDTRVTVLGHVQRGGKPSCFDRVMATTLGYAAADEALNPEAQGLSRLIGLRGNRVSRMPLMECVEQTHAVADHIAAGDYDAAMDMRGSTFKENFDTFSTLIRTFPRPPQAGQKRFRLAVLNASGAAPGMNTATRAAVRIGIDRGHIMLGVRNGFRGLIDDDIEAMDWMSVSGWAPMGGSELGTARMVPEDRQLYTLARNLEKHDIQGLLVIGGWSGYMSAYRLYQQRENYPSFNIPIMCLPVSINNNLPGSELAIGADTALNSIVEVVDKIKQSAVASRRVFVVEVYGRFCGYLALMGGLATGAERVYLPEEGVNLSELQADVERLKEGFSKGKRLGLLIRNECANPTFDTNFMCSLFKEEGGGLFEVRQSILGHIQTGGDPTAFDRIQATRLARRCVEFLIDQAEQGGSEAAFIGQSGAHVRIQSLKELPEMVDFKLQRPKVQPWLAIRPLNRILSQPGPGQPGPGQPVR